MEFLTVQEISAILRVHRHTVIKYIKDKENPLPAKKIGKGWKVLRSDFEKWLKG